MLAEPRPPAAGWAVADKLLYTPEEAARALGIGRSKVFDLLARRQLRSVRIDACRRIPASALVEFIESLLAEQTEEAAG